MKLMTKNNDVDIRRLRLTLGWLALLLPWIVAILVHMIPDSISATYYTYEGGPVFMIILGACSLMLIAYKGYDKRDDILFTIAGIFGLCICLFPCGAGTYEFVGTFQLPIKVSSIIHNSSAVIFFGILSYGTAFRFTKSNGAPSKKKKIRNIIYYICAGGMIGAFVLFPFPDFYAKTWLIETIALFFFGIAFLTKSNAYYILAAEDSGKFEQAFKNFGKKLDAMTETFMRLGKAFSNVRNNIEAGIKNVEKECDKNTSNNGPTMTTAKRILNSIYGDPDKKSDGKNAETTDTDDWDDK